MTKYIFKYQMPKPEEWIKLRSFAGWTLYDPIIFQKASKRTLYAISVYNHNQIIGMGRVVGDGIICFYIQDVVVLPQYRKQGIGHEIVDNLLSWIKKRAQDNSVIALMSSKGTEPFYEKLGFIRRPNNDLGSGMIYPLNIKNHSNLKEL